METAPYIYYTTRELVESRRLSRVFSEALGCVLATHMIRGVVDLVLCYCREWGLADIHWVHPLSSGLSGESPALSARRRHIWGNAGWKTNLAWPSFSSGKWYASILILQNDVDSSGHVRVGVGPKTIQTHQLGGGDAENNCKCYAWYETGNVQEMTSRYFCNYDDSHDSDPILSYFVGDVLGFLDLENKLFHAFHNGKFKFSCPLTKDGEAEIPFFFAACCGDSGKVKLLEPRDTSAALPDELNW